MADFETINRTVGGVDDQRIIVDNVHAPLVRTMSIGSNWNELIVGARVSVTRKTQWTSPPRWFMGLCHGVESPPGSLSPQHFVGIRGNSSSWTLHSSGDGLTFGSTGAFIQFGSIQNGADVGFTSAGGVATGKSFSFGENLQPSGIFFKITKGSPYQITTCHPNGSMIVGMDLSWYIDIMNGLSFPSSGGYTNNSYTKSDIDEGTYGALDSICFVFLGSTDGFEISDIGYARLA